DKNNLMLQDTGNLEELEQVIMAITVTPKPGASTSNSPKNIGIVIEGVKVITGLRDITRLCSVLLGLTYALDLDYPRQLKYIFEGFQKLFLELDDSTKLSNKVQSLKSKLQV
ncbi:sterile alpha motif domain-containing protein 3-like, partial [Silurus meridionalis]